MARTSAERPTRTNVSPPADPRAEDGAALARYYDLDVSHERADIPMYLALAAASDGPILELACGSGRVCVPLASAGHRVTGVDRDPHMLDRARAAWAAGRGAAPAGASLELVRADMTELALKARFDLVILAFNGLLLLPDRAAQETVLRVVVNHLTADGRAVIDIWLPTPGDLELYDGRLMEDWVRRDPLTGERVAKSTSATYNAASGRATVQAYFDAWRGSEGPRRTNRRDEIQFVSAADLLELIEATGLRPQLVAGDYSMTDLAPDSERLIVVAAGPAGQSHRPKGL